MDAVIFDLGGVLMENGSPRDFTSRFPDHDPAEVARLLMGPHDVDGDHPWHQVERGEITLEECRRLTREVLAEAGVTLPTPPPGSSPTIQFRINHEMIDLVRELRAAGLATAVLTNNVREFRPLWWPLLPYEELFDVIVDSHEVGMRKPAAPIYLHTLALLGMADRAPRAAFLDDIEANVVGARVVGLHGIQVEADHGPAVRACRELAGL